LSANSDPVQHTGPGHHSFTDSHNNCVNFANSSGTAFLNDSNFNLINEFGTNDTVHDFNNSNHNTILFDAPGSNTHPGANNDTLTASNANGNTFEFFNTATNDFPSLLGTSDTTGLLGVSGSNDFLVFDSSCTGRHIYTASNTGTSATPIVVC
jgi:hypothetical protein